MGGELQLEMNFSARRNRFKSALDRGDFVLLIECAPPESVIDPAAGTAQLAELESAVLGMSRINAALAITDHGGAGGGWRAVEYARGLSEENRDRHVVYVSGADTGESELANLVSIAGNAGNVNLVPVTGAAPAGCSARECRRRTFTGSVAAVRQLASAGIFTGAAVNPYQYTPYALLGQYGKLVKKLHGGAGFVVAQAGWDMLKLQSLNWYLTGRELCYPAIARLMLLTPDRVEKITSGACPGLVISSDFKRILDKELLYSRTQFEAAQYRRLELQAAGCRLLGYSGVQLAGAEYPMQARIAAERIAAALSEFTNFEQWLDEYNSYLASVEMAPFPDGFKLYDRVLSRPYPVDDPPRANELRVPEINRGERVFYQLRRFLFRHADRRRPGYARVLKTLLAGCRGCGNCRLPQWEYVCTQWCPKRIADGPCGGVRPDGGCEVTGSECVFVRAVRLAVWRGELPELEKN